MLESGESREKAERRETAGGRGEVRERGQLCGPLKEGSETRGRRREGRAAGGEGCGLTEGAVRKTVRGRGEGSWRAGVREKAESWGRRERRGRPEGVRGELGKGLLREGRSVGAKSETEPYGRGPVQSGMITGESGRQRREESRRTEGCGCSPSRVAGTWLSRLQPVSLCRNLTMRQEEDREGRREKSKI